MASVRIVLDSPIIFNRSTWSLFATNIFIILIALYQRWDLRTILMLYWAQSVIIGLFQFIKLWGIIESEDTETRINGHPIVTIQASHIIKPFYFLFHYGLIHYIYLTFLYNQFSSAFFNLPVFSTSIAIGIFLINHFVSYKEYRKSDQKKTYKQITSFAYARVMPIHMTLFLGGNRLQ